MRKMQSQRFVGILAALSDFDGQLQASDMSRFLEKVTATIGKPIYQDWYLMPEEDRILPFFGDTFNFTQAEEKIMKQEGYLRIENDRLQLLGFCGMRHEFAS